MHDGRREMTMTGKQYTEDVSYVSYIKLRFIHCPSKLYLILKYMPKKILDIRICDIT